MNDLEIFEVDGVSFRCPKCKEALFSLPIELEGFFNCVNGCDWFIFKHNYYSESLDIKDQGGKLIIIMCTTFYYFG